MTATLMWLKCFTHLLRINFNHCCVFIATLEDIISLKGLRCFRLQRQYFVICP